MSNKNIDAVRKYINNGYFHDLVSFLNEFKSDVAIAMIFVACRDGNTSFSLDKVIVEIATIRLIDNLSD